MLQAKVTIRIDNLSLIKLGSSEFSFPLCPDILASIFGSVLSNFSKNPAESVQPESPPAMSDHP